MAGDNTANEPVAADTDDLDAFTNLLYGKAEEAVVEEEVKEESPESDDSNTDEAVDGNPDDADETPEVEDEDDSSDAEPEDEADDDGQEVKLAGRKKKTAQERISEITAKLREAERREADALRRLTEREAAEDNPQKEQKTDTLEDGAPDPDATLEDGSVKYPLGEFDPTYIRDLTKFTIRREQEEARREDQEAAIRAQEETARRELITEWEGKLETATAEYPDLRTKAASLEDTFVDLDQGYGEYLATTIMSLDKGPDVLYYLANNLNEAQKIVDMGPAKATLALGRLEAQFIKDEKGEVKKVVKESKAAPPPPRNRGGTASVSINGDTDDLDAFEKAFYKKK